jgi:hypothetical protein
MSKYRTSLVQYIPSILRENILFEGDSNIISVSVGTAILAMLLVTEISVLAKVVRISFVKATVMRIIIDSEITPPVTVL